MSEHELSAALSLTRTADRLDRKHRAWQRRRRRGAQIRRGCVSQCVAAEAERRAGLEPTGEVPF
jgi:hypothetical protein